MAQQDYCEIILNAVSQIVTAETAAKQNKGMIACRVKDITERNLGRYSVNYKGDTFLACGEATDYEIDDEVYVLRAENTGSQLSIIVGRKLREDEFPIQINDPLTKMMRLKEWRPTSASGVYEVTPSAPYDTIGLSFDAIGEFTITLKVVNTVGRTYTYELDETNFLFSSDFGIALTQRCTIDISRTGTLLRVELSTTGDLTNFIVDFGYNITNKLESDKALKLYTEGEQKYYTDSFGNLKENNTVNLYLDWLYLDENAEIKSLTHINYLENKPLGFDVNWYKQTEGADGDFYSGPGWTKIEPVGEISKAETEVLAKNNNLFALSGGEKALFSGDLVQTAIKAVVIYTPVGATAVEAIVSNELVFENIQDEPLEYITRGSIELSDGSNAVYPLWALNGFLKTQNDVYKERQFNFSYSTGLGIEALYKNIASVTWYIPKANMYYFSKERISSTAIQSLEGEYAVLTIIPFEAAAAKDNQGNNLTGDDLYKGALKEIFRADYKLMERYITNRISNKVICEINFKDETETWKQERDLYFSKAGLDGTGSQILIWLTDSKTGNLARNVQPGEISYTVHTLFIDENGNEVNNITPTITLQKGMSSPSSGQGKYSNWTYTSPKSVTNNDEELIYCDILKVQYIIESLNTDDTKEITETIYTFDETNNKIVKTESDKTITIKPPTTYTEYYPISYALEVSYGFEGPTYITYDSSGKNPVYDNIALTLWDKNKKYETPSNYVLVWDLNYQVDGNYTQALPKIKTYSDMDKVYPADYYENNIEYICNITASRLNINTATQQILFVQPLVIRQARHFSTILDNWDGNFKIDADGNYVLSSALVAGNKEGENNTFNGIIAGTLNTIMEVEVPFTSPYPIDKDGNPIMTDDDGSSLQEDTIVYRTNTIYRENQTGILGYKDGAQTFGFLDDGTAFIGPSGKGQILVNGTDGKIKSGNTFVQARRSSKTGVITTEGTGMVIDFANGGIYAPNFILDPNGDASFAGRISAAWGTVGGYTIASRMLYATAGENKYMALLSPKYASATYENIDNNNTNITTKDYVQDMGLENWYYDKKGEKNNDPATWHKYEDIPLIENQAGPGLIIENNKRRLRAFFEKNNQFYPQFMVDYYTTEEKTVDGNKVTVEKNISNISIGYDKDDNSKRPGLFGESPSGRIELRVPGDQTVSKILYYGALPAIKNAREPEFPEQHIKVETKGAFQYFENLITTRKVLGTDEPIYDFNSSLYLGNNMLALTTTEYSTFLSSIGFVFGSKEFIKDFNPVNGGSKDKLPDDQYFFKINTPQNRKAVNGWTINSAGLAYLKTGPTTGSRFQLEQQSLLFETYKDNAAVTSQFKINTSNDVFLLAEHNNQPIMAIKADDSKDLSVFNIQTNNASIAGLHIWSETTKEQKSIPTTYSLPRVSSKFDQITFDDGSGGATAPDDDTGSSGSGTSSTTTTKTIYISTKAKDITVPSTDKIVFNVPVEFSRETEEDNDTTGGVILSNITPVFNSKHNHDGLLVQNTQTETWSFIHGSDIMGGNGVLKGDTYNRYYTAANSNNLYKLTSEGLVFSIRDVGNNIGYCGSNYSVNQLEISHYTINANEKKEFDVGAFINPSRLWTARSGGNTVALDADEGLSLIAASRDSCTLGYDDTEQAYTLTVDTDFIIDAPSLKIGEVISLDSKGTGKLKVADFTYYGENGMSIGSSSGIYTITTDASGLVISGALDATTLYENSEALEDIYLKKKLLRLDDNYKNIIGFDQTYYVNGGDSSGTYTNYYTLSNYGTASKVTINADKLTYYYLGDYNKNDTIVTVKATNISYYKEGLEYSGEASDTKTISGTATTTITNYKTITCGNTVTCTGICSCGEEVTCTGTCTDWWYWTNGTSDLEIPWQAQVKAIADSSFAIGDTDISTTIQIEQL